MENTCSLCACWVWDICSPYNWKKKYYKRMRREFNKLNFYFAWVLCMLEDD